MVLLQVCAANFGDICSVVGQQATEEMLVSISDAEEQTMHYRVVESLLTWPHEYKIE